jgi:hypothetical protein
MPGEAMTSYLLAIKHCRQLSFDFPRFGMKLSDTLKFPDDHV